MGAGLKAGSYFGVDIHHFVSIGSHLRIPLFHSLVDPVCKLLADKGEDQRKGVATGKPVLECLHKKLAKPYIAESQA